MNNSQIVQRRNAVPPLSHARISGSVLLMTLVYTILFGSLATVMYSYSVGNLRVGNAEMETNRALIAAESGMAYTLVQFRTAGMPVINEGSIHLMSTPSLVWSGANIEGLGSSNNGIARQLATGFNSCGVYVTSGATAANPTGTNPLNIPAIALDGATDDSNFTITITYDSTNPIYLPLGSNAANATSSYVLLHITSVGKSGGNSRTVTMDVQLQKTLKYAVYSNVAIQLGKNVHIQGDIASAYTGTGKGPTVQSFSDWHYLPTQAGIDTDLATLRTLLNQYDLQLANRLDVRDPNSAAATAAQHAGLKDRNGDGFIDDYDIALLHLDTNFNAANPSASDINDNLGEFTNSQTGKEFDPDLMTLIDSPMGAGNGNGKQGYGDLVINNLDAYSKINGSIKVALTSAQWSAAASGWSQYGDSGGVRLQDLIEGPIIPSDPTQAPMQFGVDFSSELAMTPQTFSTSAIDASIPNATAAVSGSTISNGTLTAAMANGGTVTEHSPASVTSGWQATYTRPVFKNMTFTNVRIPQGLNAQFVNCTFTGTTMVKMNTKIVDPAGTANTNPDGSTPDPNAGKSWASQTVGGGTFTADGVSVTTGSGSHAHTTVTPLNASNSVAFTDGNNLHFTGCTFNGPLAADIPSAYTHFADSWEFDTNTSGSTPVPTTINNTQSATGVAGTFTIMAPNTNIEVGSYIDPSNSNTTANLVGVVVAGNIDIRGSATVDGSLIVTGNGAGNTTLGYFGSTDSGQAVPPLSQLPAEANGKYGHLFFRYNSSRGMPSGIKVPLVPTYQFTTYKIQ